MWRPGTVQLPIDLIQDELNQKIPAGSTLAIAAFILEQADTTTAKTILKKYHLSRDAAATAWRYLTTGSTETGSGERLNVGNVESPKKNEPSAFPIGNRQEYIEPFLKYFPNEDPPTPAQFDMIAAYPLEQVDDVLYQMANSGSKVNNPVILCLWKLKNEDADKHKSDRAKIQRKGLSDEAIVQRVIREAEAQIESLEPPKATEAGLQTLREKKERLNRGRP